MNKRTSCGVSSCDPRIEYFDALAAGWDTEGASGGEMIAFLRKHGKLLGLVPGQNLLEVGCGTGKTTAWLAAQVAPGRTTAVDFSPEMIQQARQKGIDAEFHCADACSDDLGRNCYDVILCFHSFPHFRDQLAALRNLSRSLNAAGRVIVMHMAGSGHINEFHASIDGPVRGDALPAGDAWTELLERAGMQLVRLIDREDLFFLEAAGAAT